MNGLEKLGYTFESENECITIYNNGLYRIYFNDCEAWKTSKNGHKVSLMASEIEVLNELMNESKELKVLEILISDTDNINHYIDENGIRMISFGKDSYIWQEDWDTINFDLVWNYLEEKEMSKESKQ